MLDWFIWNGISCTEYGIHVSEQPAITIPAERVTYTDVPGKSGSLAVTEGSNVYADLTLTVKCFVSDMSRLGEITAWLKGSGKRDRRFESLLLSHTSLLPQQGIFRRKK